MPEDIAALLEERDRRSADLSRTESQLAEAERHLLNGGQEYNSRFAEHFGYLQDQRAKTNYDLGRLDAMIEDRRAQAREISGTAPTDKSGNWWRERTGSVAPPSPADVRQRDWWNDNRQNTQDEQEQDQAEDREPTRNR